MNHSLDDVEDRLRADAPRLATEPTPAVVDLIKRADRHRRRRSVSKVAACFAALASVFILLPRQDRDRSEPAVTVTPPPSVPPDEEPIHVNLVVNDAGVLEVRARRGEVFCVIPLDDRDDIAPEEVVAEPVSRAVPFWQIEPAAQDRFIEAWIDAGQMPGLEV